MIRKFSVTPYLVVDKYAVWRWENKDLPDIWAVLTKMRKASKEVTGYTFDNEHYYVKDVYGKLCVSFSVSHVECIPCYSAKYGNFIGNAKDGREVNAYIDHLTDGDMFCNAGRHWYTPVDAKDYIPYGFGSRACEKCYDPKKHLPPDTRGD